MIALGSHQGGGVLIRASAVPNCGVVLQMKRNTEVLYIYYRRAHVKEPTEEEVRCPDFKKNVDITPTLGNNQAGSTTLSQLAFLG